MLLVAKYIISERTATNVRRPPWIVYDSASMKIRARVEAIVRSIQLSFFVLAKFLFLLLKKSLTLRPKDTPVHAPINARL